MKTNVRDTSLEAYDDLNPRQSEIIDAIQEMGGGWVTRRQVAEHIAEKRGERVVNTGSVAARINELITANRLEEMADRMPCPITGKAAHHVRIPETKLTAAA